LFEQTQCSRGEPIAAALVAGEAGLVDEHDVAPVTGEGDGGGRTSRPAADYGDISGEHSASG